MKFQKKIILLIFFLPFILIGQNSIKPTLSFIKPLDIPLELSGTFGELRSNHFHSGIDIKTQQREGLKVFASAEGYVSRIKMSFWGYGKAIYVTHPNGYTTVYGHLSRFNDQIEKYIKTVQYQQKKYDVEVFPSAAELPLERGEILAYSGNTGGSGGPHLHFEIRKTSNQHPVNPLLFGIDVLDHKNPIVNKLFCYPISNNAHINQSESAIQINLSASTDKILRADTVYAFGDVGFAINTYDKQDIATNQNGVYSIELKLDGKRWFYHEMDEFSFSETKYINTHIDYAYYKKEFSMLQKCYVEPYNRLTTYDRTVPNNGVIHVEDGKKYLIEIAVCDAAQNETIITIPIIGKNTQPTKLRDSTKTDYFIKHLTTNTFDLDSVTVTFPKYTLYEDTYLDIQKIDAENIQVHEDILPLSSRFKIAFDVSKYPVDYRKHLYIGQRNYKGDYYRISSTLKGNILEGSTKKLGYYKVLHDLKSPTIVPLNFKPEQWLSKKKVLQFKIADELSGIDSYSGKINGEWVLFEWDYKTGILTYDFSDKKWTEKKKTVEIIVTDHANNTKTYRTSFYRVDE